MNICNFLLLLLLLLLGTRIADLRHSRIDILPDCVLALLARTSEHLSVHFDAPSEHWNWNGNGTVNRNWCVRESGTFGGVLLVHWAVVAIVNMVRLNHNLCCCSSDADLDIDRSDTRQKQYRDLLCKQGAKMRPAE